MTNTTNTAAANTAVVRTFAAVADTVYELKSLTVSYSGTVPTIGLLTITDNAVGVLSMDIPLALNTPFTLPLSVVSSAPNQALVITVAAGGTGAIAKLNTMIKSNYVVL